MKRVLMLVIASFIAINASHADEGMWLLPYIQKYNIKDMKAKGFKLTAEDIYSLNQASLKDAIVIFGGGCTGEVMSDQGLVFTNHHCGFGSIQKLSTFENDYLNNGYWAKTLKEELPAEGLGVVFIRQIVDVSERILPALNDKMTEKERRTVVDSLIQVVAPEYDDSTKNLEVSVMPMFGGNQYLLFVNERFGDVRLVGTPPQSIGNYGGDTDNWMWPRHTGDFSIFRIYASPSNEATAKYAQDNVPYKPKKHLTVSSKGYKDGDFAMILGFPGTTTRYMTTWEIDKMLRTDNPIRITVRGEKQKIWWEDMCADPKVRLQYADKYAGSSNYWKNSIGKSRGVLKLNVKGQKQAEQDAFTAWVNQSPERVAKYGDALKTIENSVVAQEPISRILSLYNETLSGTEAFRVPNTIKVLYTSKFKGDTLRDNLKLFADKFFKNYNTATDLKTTKKMLHILADSLSDDQLPAYFVSNIKGDIDGWVDNFFATSPVVNKEKFIAALTPQGIDSMVNSPAVTFIEQYVAIVTPIIVPLQGLNIDYARGKRLYMAGLMEMQPDKAMYPDANFTMRMTYGQVKPYKPADAVFYDFKTTLSGVIDKEDTTNPEFKLAPKLKQLWLDKDFGRWAVNGDIPVAFLSTNDITGGNSGSPVLNARGELLGLAFDGNWEAMSGDIAFEPALQRTINVDIRYVLFIIDKFAGCQRLIDEMTIN